MFRAKSFQLVWAVFSFMKEKLTKVKEGKIKNFGYGSIMISFALERIPLLQPQLISLAVSGPRNPRMQRWTDLMARRGAHSTIVFTPTFFEWFNRQAMTFTEYPYSGMDFHGDPDLPLPIGSMWGDIGKLFDQVFFIF